jgi:hypothetical protein
MPDTHHPPTRPHAFRCPSCASLKGRCLEIGPMIGRREYDVLIVCMACDAVTSVPAAHT